MSLLLLIALLVGLALALYGWLATRTRRASLWRLERSLEPDDRRRRRIGPPPARFPPRHRWLAPVLAVTSAIGLAFVLQWPFVLGAGALIGAIAFIVEQAVADARSGRIEQQLAAALDIIVATVHAGGSVMNALSAALEEAKPPIKPFLRDVFTRLQLGDAPEDVLEDLAQRVPLESFRLFALTLAVHWKVGGSLASPLAIVARTVRDRAELSRRIRTQSAEAHFSVAVVLVIAYAVAFLMWRTNPESVERFFRSPVGAELTGGVIALQAIGLLWMSRISQIEY